MLKGIIKRMRSCEGFSLIEAAICMALTLFILQGIAMVSLYAQRSSIYSRRLTSANMLSEQLMEQYRNKDYDNLAAFVGAAPADECFTVHMASVACGTNDAYFTRSTTVTNGPIANILAVDVTTAWAESLAWSSHQETGVQNAKLVSLISKF